MLRLTTLAAAAVLALGASAAQAITIPSEYTSSNVISAGVSGEVLYDGPTSPFGLTFGEFFDAGPNDLSWNVDSTDLSEESAAAFYFGSVLVNGASEIDIMAEVAEFFFEDILTDMAYLVRIDVTGQGLDFAASDAAINTDARVSLTEFSKSAVVPLPATLPLLAFAAGGLALTARRKRKAA